MIDVTTPLPAPTCRLALIETGSAFYRLGDHYILPAQDVTFLPGGGHLSVIRMSRGLPARICLMPRDVLVQKVDCKVEFIH